MYNLLEYSSNYSDLTGSLWFYSKDEATNFNAGVADDNNFKSFSGKVKLSGNSCRWNEWNLKKHNNRRVIKVCKKFLKIT